MQNTSFSGIESSEYRLLSDSSLTIKGQHFDNTEISEADSKTERSIVEIVGSMTIQVTEGGATDNDDEEDSDDEYKGGDS
ncbi:MAG: hypothetical protein M3270_06030, partial [Thermoproteota archaeon]|nr:hypothetical protein [Thermoproteota archaeon]